VSRAPVGMAISDIHGDFTYVNPALLNMLGYSEDEIYHPNIVISHPDDQHKNQKIRQELTSSPHTPIVTEKRYLHKDGRVILGLISMTTLLDSKDNIKYFIAQVTNISDQKKIEKSASLFRHMINSSHETMFVIDPPTGKILDSNINGCISLGYTYQEMLNRSIFDIDTNMSSEYEWDKVIATIRNTKSILFDGMQKHKNNDTLAVEMSLTHVEIDEHEYILALSRDISERKKAERTIWQQANYDSITNLPNRNMLYDQLKNNIEKSRHDNIQFAVLCLDIDQFKEVNDTLGHHTGDKLLSKVGQRIQAEVSAKDLVSRLGGDEFCLLIHNDENANNVNDTANRILKALSTPFTINNHKIYSSASIGITLFPNNAQDVDGLLQQSDQAMYVAKDKGRNCFQYFTLSMQEKALERMELSRDLHQAIYNNELHIVYQPIYSFGENKPHKAEALLRWQHPQRGLVSPTDFIPIAEANGTIDTIGDWLFSEVINTIQKWKTQHNIEMQISINASPLYFREGNEILNRWCQELEASPLSGESIIIEITEGLLLDTSQHVTEQLLMLKNAGMPVALDDFGTGYSSLSYLNKLDIDYLKIDKSFIDHLTAGSNEQALCEAIIVMAHKLKLHVITEGIETQEQYQLIQQMDCDYGQGLLLSKPLRAQEIENLLNSQPGHLP
jgi:diguanylate cyclase (GGDEF)-like protein/PAS domain S-box-containing protein